MVREARRKAKLPGNAQPHDSRPMMSDELFRDCYESPVLRDRIRRSAAIIARGKCDLVEDYMQIGWMHVAHCKPYQDLDYYATMAERAMERERWKARSRVIYALDTIECMTRSEYAMWERGSY